MFLCPFLAACTGPQRAQGAQSALKVRFPALFGMGAQALPLKSTGHSTRPKTCTEVPVRGSHHVKERVAIAVDTGQKLRALVQSLLDFFCLPKLDGPEQLLRLRWLLHGRQLLL